MKATFWSVGLFYKFESTTFFNVIYFSVHSTISNYKHSSMKWVYTNKICALDSQSRRWREWLTVFKNSNQIELVSEAKQLSNDLITHFACCEPLNIDTFSIDFEEITQPCSHIPCKHKRMSNSSCDKHRYSNKI